jgi:hypothetical protein
LTTLNPGDGEVALVVDRNIRNLSLLNIRRA